MLRRLAEQRSHGSTTWHVSQTPPGKVITGYGGDTYAGKDVTLSTAMSITAVYACIRGISETLSTLPKILYQRIPGGGKRRAYEHSLYPILHDALNPEHTAQWGWEIGGAWVLAWGNAYYQIIRTKGGEVAELWPLSSDRMWIERKGNQKLYHYRQQNGKTRDFPADEIMHVPGLGFDGLMGLSPLQLARNALATTLAAEEFGGKFFSNGARPGIVLEHPKTLSKLAEQNLRTSFLEEHQGSENSHGVFVAEEGMKVQVVGVPPEDAQLLELLSFQIAEVARIYGYPLALLQEHDKAATYASVEQFMLSYVTHTIRPWAVRFDQAINHSLLSPDERGVYFCETLMDSLLRGDIETRYAAYAIGRQWGWLSADDILAMENRNPLPGRQGQVYLTPLNMVPADMKRNFEPTVAEAAGRIVRREIHDLREGLKKHKTAEALAAWLDGFYQEHTEFIRKALDPVLETYSRLTNSQAAQGSTELAQSWCEENRKVLVQLSDQESIAGLLDSWEKELPGLLIRMIQEYAEKEGNNAA